MKSTKTSSNRRRGPGISVEEVVMFKGGRNRQGS